MTSISNLVENVRVCLLQNAIDITFENITYSVQVEDQHEGFRPPCTKKYIQKQLIKNVSGIFKAGEVTAIMGASGAGKTTLLNILACRVPRKYLEGKIYANDTEYNFEAFGDFANYVMQSDVLLQTLTVRETLQFAAHMKLNLSDQEKKKRVNTLAAKLKLEKCLDVIVGGPIIKGISGGEKKRTSIAFELISDPQVLILDEPTSGLDSLTSYIIVDYLKRLAKTQKKTIFMTIHQPNAEIFQLFDRLILLVEGKIIYQGKGEAATEYFGKNFGLQCPEFANPADYFMSVMHQESAQNKKRFPQYFQCYEKLLMPQIKNEIVSKDKSAITRREVNVPFSISFKTLINRDLTNVLRNPMLIKLRFIQTIFLAIYTGGLYCRFSGDHNNNISWSAYTGYFFFLSINLLMMSLVPVQLIFPSERAVFLKEQGAKLYSVTSYFVSRNLIEVPYSIIFPLISSLIMYWFVGLSSTPQQFFIFYLINFLIGFAGSSMGLMLGSVVNDAKSVSSITPVILLPFFLFSGQFKNAGNYPDWIDWVQYISPIKYSFQAYVQNEVQYTTSKISTMNFDLSLWSDIAILFGLGIGARLLSLFFLWLLRAKLE